MKYDIADEPVAESVGISKKPDNPAVESEDEGAKTERTILIGHGFSSWSKRDKYLVLLNVLFKLGDAIEIYLPGIVTQVLACSMGVTKFQEGWLGVAFYITLAISTVITAPIANRVGRRPILIFSVYLSIFTNIFCAAVPENYFFILASRLCVGLCVGLNMSTSSVFVAENVSSDPVYKTAIFLDSFFFAAGTGWVAVLGYFLLDTLGWRIFFLLTSLPVFVPSIILLHCCIPSEESATSYKQLPTTGSDDERESPIQVRKDGTGSLDTVPNFKLRLFKAGVMNFLNFMQGYGCILLLPALLRLNNEREEDTSKRCQSSVHGVQFLEIALITGGAQLLGRFTGLWVSDRFRFWVVQFLLALVMLACYGTLLLINTTLAVMICLFIACVAYSMTRLELKLMECDINYFGRANVAVASATILGFGYSGSILGASLAEFLSPPQAVLWTFILSWFLLLSACSIREYKN